MGKEDGRSGVDFGGKPGGNEGRSGNEHTHAPRIYTHAAILLADTIVTSTPFLPLPGRWWNVDFPHALATAPVAIID